MKNINSEERSTGEVIFRVVFNALMAVILFLFLVSAAVFLVLALKPLYYWFIDLFKIEAYSGYNAADLKANYDALIDYNMFWGPKELIFPDHGMVTTEETMAHFVDVKQVFVFFQYLAIGSAVLLIPGCIVAKKKNITLWPKITLALAVAVIVGVGIGLAFFWDSFFIKFHEILFPGKTNWYINSNYDKIILVLPSEVFLADAAAILILIALGIVLFLVFFRKQKNPEAREQKKQERKARREAKKAERAAQKEEQQDEKSEEQQEEQPEEPKENDQPGEEEKSDEPKEDGQQQGEAKDKEQEEVLTPSEEKAGEAALAAAAIAEETIVLSADAVEETVEESREAAAEAEEEAKKKAEEAKTAVASAMAAAEETVVETREAAEEGARKAAEASEGSTAETFEEMDEEIAKTVEAFAESFEELDF
ncbi:MAG: TIGR01906 family membrane protein [Lachnospiraceae bacterium]|nr:TIGR01906 family membrane protein [Lachnospiraceae bacterium]